MQAITVMIALDAAIIPKAGSFLINGKRLCNNSTEL